ncbi:hypothetical protein NEA10_08920 [Phormidium yuhuli AB48]|uniref:DUF5666 domain-containing protein n=1 Tax=Phormidium yuhuli AB48 TaxID=2940671 RepID=A0ABY5AWZ4_9CYAN|nr:hypothetical protein [Phormidium yuhuli]USR92816.1 hypothetical protein NEA10_08920 [Phormidium yuhuli AB48]
MKLTGVVKHVAMGTGAWTLETGTGQVYELHESTPSEVLKPGQSVTLEGTVRDDVMTLAALGPVFEVKSFQLGPES